MSETNIAQGWSATTLTLNLNNNVTGYLTLNGLMNGYKGDPADQGCPPSLATYIPDDGKAHKAMYGMSNVNPNIGPVDPYSNVIGSASYNFPDATTFTIEWDSRNPSPFTITTESTTYEVSTPSLHPDGAYYSKVTKTS
ncbi:MAG: hypothetical protein AAF570_16165 [Bacteroidota bacterium]